MVTGTSKVIEQTLDLVALALSSVEKDQVGADTEELSPM